jgi:hypothetical protein
LLCSLRRPVLSVSSHLVLVLVRFRTPFSLISPPLGPILPILPVLPPSRHARIGGIIVSSPTPKTPPIFPQNPTYPTCHPQSNPPSPSPPPSLNGIAPNSQTHGNHPQISKPHQHIHIHSEKPPDGAGDGSVCVACRKVSIETGMITTFSFGLPRTRYSADWSSFSFSSYSCSCFSPPSSLLLHLLVAPHCPMRADVPPKSMQQGVVDELGGVHC